MGGMYGLLSRLLCVRKQNNGVYVFVCSTKPVFIVCQGILRLTSGKRSSLHSGSQTHPLRILGEVVYF